MQTTRGERIELLLIYVTSMSVTPTSHFTPGERTPGTHCTGGWVSLKAGLDTEVREKILFMCWGSNHGRPIVQFLVVPYTD
jgi:hypothetical protein